MIFDTHSHYNDEKFDEDRDSVIKDAYNKGITRIVCAGYNLDSSKFAIELSEKYDFIYATCGISPNDIENNSIDNLKEIKKLASNPKVVAIGEIGLDYYWNKENKELQKELFIKQIELANRVEKPIVIHTRDSISDTLDILKNSIKAEQKGVFHCCPFNIELIKEAVKLGFYISFSGTVTFKNAKPEKVIKEVPTDRIVIETDCPYLAPEPFRGKRNDSRYMNLILEKVSDIKQIRPEEMAKIIYENSNNLFKIF